MGVDIISDSIEEEYEKNKYYTLRKYFRYLDFNDLEIFTCSEIISYCEPKDRLIMKVFIDKYLIDFLE